MRMGIGKGMGVKPVAGGDREGDGGKEQEREVGIDMEIEVKNKRKGIYIIEVRSNGFHLQDLSHSRRILEVSVLTDEGNDFDCKQSLPSMLC